MLNFDKYEERYKTLYPDYTDEQLREIFELKIDFLS